MRELQHRAFDVLDRRSADLPEHGERFDELLHVLIIAADISEADRQSLGGLADRIKREAHCVGGLPETRHHIGRLIA